MTTAFATLPRPARDHCTDGPAAMPAVLISALAHYLDSITLRLGAGPRSFGDTLVDAEDLAGGLAKPDFAERVQQVAAHLDTITDRLEIPTRPAREVQADAVWLLMRLDQLQGWTSGWLGGRG